MAQLSGISKLHVEASLSAVILLTIKLRSLYGYSKEPNNTNHKVMYIANRKGWYELVDYLYDRKNWPEYNNFIITGDTKRA